MSNASISNSFNAEIVSSILTESLDTTYEYVVKAGVAVLCSPPTSLDFVRKFSLSLMSNIMRHLISWYPIGRSSLRFSQTLNVVSTCFISFIIASHHSVSPFSLSISIAPFTVFGILIPYVFPLNTNLPYFCCVHSSFIARWCMHECIFLYYLYTICSRSCGWV